MCFEGRVLRFVDGLFAGVRGEDDRGSFGVLGRKRGALFIKMGRRWEWRVGCVKV